jgi:hypothetical protein
MRTLASFPIAARRHGEDCLKLQCRDIAGIFPTRRRIVCRSESRKNRHFLAADSFPAIPGMLAGAQL